jgi:enterochelin esterase family protein
MRALAGTLCAHLLAATSALAADDYKLGPHFEYGDGGHTHKHGGALLPDTLRWLWRDYPK